MHQGKRASTVNRDEHQDMSMPTARQDSEGQIRVKEPNGPDPATAPRAVTWGNKRAGDGNRTRTVSLGS